MYSNNEGSIDSPNTKTKWRWMTMTHILINRYEDNVRFGEKAQVVEMTLDTAKKMNVARMDFVIREGNRCSVSNSYGVLPGMASLTKDFITTQKPLTLVNQVSNETEMRAMFRAGLRIPGAPKDLTLKDSLVRLAERRSVMMSLPPQK